MHLLYSLYIHLKVVDNLLRGVVEHSVVYGKAVIEVFIILMNTGRNSPL